MSLVGNLADMSLPAVLQFLSRAGGSGKLTLSSLDGSALIVFRRGKVIYAASNSVRETFGSLLVSRGLVDQGTLKRGLELQHHAREERRLGTILIEMGAISQETLDTVIRGQVSAVVRELSQWREGFFRFDAMEVEEHGEVEVDTRELLLEHGVDAESLSREAELLREAEEGFVVAQHEPAVAVEPAKPPPPPDTGETAAQPPPGPPPAAESVSLRSFIGSPLSPSVTAELTQHLMERAGKVFHRCVLFAIRGGQLVAMGGFGVGPESGGGGGVHGIRLPLDEPSVLSYTVGAGETYHGPMHGIAGDQNIVAALGGVLPAEVVVLPIEVSWEVVALLYGDNAPDSAPIGSVEELELAIMDTELAMERAMASDPGEPRERE